MFPYRNLKQKVTRWKLLGLDGFGGFTFDEPEVLPARWEDRSEIYRSREGDEVVSNAICYTKSDINEGDYLALGEFDDSDPTAVQRAYRVVQCNRITDLRAMTMHYKVYM